MIFVTLGTQDKLFVRLLQMIEIAIEAGTIKDEVIVQAGYTVYNTSKMKVFDYIDIEEFNDYLDKADYIISHAGVGSILSAIKLRKKIIVCPRRKKYREHTNDHQLEISRKFATEGYVMVSENEEQLIQCIKGISKFTPRIYKSNAEIFMNAVADFIENN